MVAPTACGKKRHALFLYPDRLFLYEGVYNRKKRGPNPPKVDPLSDRQWLEREAAILNRTDRICLVCHVRVSPHLFCVLFTESGGV